MSHKTSKALLIIMALALVGIRPARADRGDQLASFNFGVAKFALNPVEPMLYASIPTLSAVAAIDTETLTVLARPFVGFDPFTMAVSPDGERLYVVLKNTNLIKVLDTRTMQVAMTFVLSGTPFDIEYGLDDRLFVVGGLNGISQLNALTGEELGDFGTAWNGLIEISPDRTMLYHGTLNVSPAYITEWDVSTLNPFQTWSTANGSNGRDLAISHAGDFICFPCGIGYGGRYTIRKFDTLTKVSLGEFDTGPYPREICYSPDDAIAYAIHFRGHIDVFDARTFELIAEIPSDAVGSQGSELQVDRTGRCLFVASPSELRVYDTGEALIPFAVSVEPSRVAHDSKPTPVTVHGRSFNVGVNAIYFGETPASAVQVISDETLTCLPPSHDAGPVDVRVVGGYGEETLEHGFVYTPAQLLSGNLIPGGQIGIEYQVDPNVFMVTLLGRPPEISRTVNGVDGTLCIDSPFILAVLYPVPFDRLTISLDIPNNPGLIGYEGLIQTLVNYTPRIVGGSFTNCAHFLIGGPAP